MNYRSVLPISILLGALCITAAESQDAANAQKAPWQRLLAGDESKRAAELQRQVTTAEVADDYKTAVEAAAELYEFRRRLQGEDHFESFNEKWNLAVLRKLADLSATERAAWKTILKEDTDADQLQRMGKFAEALPARRARLANCRDILDEDHPAVAECLARLATTLSFQRNHAEAETLFRKALDIRRRTLGENHPATGSSYNNLATSLNFQGKTADAGRLYRNALEINQQVFGDDHLSTASSCSNLAGNLQAQHQYAAAEPYLKMALAIHQKQLGDVHPVTANSVLFLAGNLHAQRRDAAAEPLYRRAAALFEQLHGEKHPETALVLNELGVNLQVQGRYADAEPFFRRALAIRQELFDEGQPAVVASLGNLAANLNSQAKYAQAEPLLERTLQICRTAFGEEHLSTAKSHDNLGVNLNSQGRHSDAEQHHEAALRIREKILGPAHPDTALSLLNLAAALDGQARRAAAEAHYRRAMEINMRVFGEDHVLTASVCNNLAMNLNSQARHADAAALALRALTVRRKVLGEFHPDSAQSYNNISIILDAQGRHAEAEPLARKALEINLRTLGEFHPNTSTGYHNLAFNLDKQGRHADAEPLYRRSIAIELKVFGEDHADLAGNYANLGDNLSDQARYAEAEAAFNSAMGICEKQPGPEHPNTARIYHTVGASLARLGNRGEAERLYRKALAISERTLNADHPQLAISYNNVASILVDRGEAEALQRKALAIWRKVLGDVHPETGVGCLNLAFMLNAGGRFDESLTFLTMSRLSYEAGRLTAAGRGGERSVLAGNGNPYPLLCATQIHKKRHREAFESLETSFARGLLEELSTRRGTSLTVEEEAERLAASVRLAGIQARISNLILLPSLNSAEQAELEKLQAERAECDRALAVLSVALSAREVAALSEIQASLNPDEALVAWVDVRNHSRGVNEHWACVLRSAGDPAFEPLPGRVAAEPFDTEDTALTGSFRQLLQRPAVSRLEIDEMSKRVYAQRLAPVAPHLRGVNKLFVIAVNAMAAIPVDLLTDRYSISYVPSGTFLARMKGRPAPAGAGILALGDPAYELERPQTPVSAELPPGGLLVKQVIPGGNAEKNGRIQAGDVLLTYAGSELKSVDDLSREVARHAVEKTVTVTVWRENETKAAARELAAGKLGVVLASDPAPLAIANRRRADQLVAAIGREGEWKPLPGTRMELKTILELFGDQATVLSGNEASESQIERLRQKKALGQFRYLHFASHGSANAIRAFDSALILARNDPGRMEFAQPGEPWIDGELTAREVLEHWELDAELVTLSACRTGLGQQGGGDGLLGFSQAFLAAGSRSVCLSLWEVDDRATALLMDRFYRNLHGRRAGLAVPLQKSAALAEAKTWLRNLTHPEVAQHLAGLCEGVARGKDQPALRVVPTTLDPQFDPAVAKPFDHPRFWAAFVLIGDPN